MDSLPPDLPPQRTSERPPLPPIIDGSRPWLRIDSPFSYQCQGCKRCCQHMLIRINPYEALRLARRLGISTTAFLAEHVDRDTAFLKLGVQGWCRFHTPEVGCSVHADRPLVCRLYPLGAGRFADGHLEYMHLHPHPQTEGQWGTQGTVGDYLQQQDTARHQAAAERLQQLFGALQAALARPAATTPAVPGMDAPPTVASPLQACDWLDVDDTLQAAGYSSQAITGLGVEEAFNAYMAWLTDAVQHHPETGV